MAKNLERIDPAELRDLLREIAGNGSNTLRLYHFLANHPEVGGNLSRMGSKPYPLGNMFIALMLERAGLDGDAIRAEFQEFLQNKDLEQICQVCTDVTYNEVGGQHLAQLALAAGLTRCGELSGAHYGISHGYDHDFGPLVCLKNCEQYFPDKVDVVVACNTIGKGSGVETLANGSYWYGTLELLASLANRLNSGGYILIENRFNDIDKDTLARLGFVEVIRDEMIGNGFLTPREMSVIQFRPETISTEDRIHMPHLGGSLAWDGENNRFELEKTSGGA